MLIKGTFKKLFWSRVTLFAVAAITFAGCGQPKVASPIDTFKTYTKAIKQKDTTAMKLLLSDATIKMHEKEAKAQGVNVDDIVKREDIFRENQKTVEFRNEKIDGDKATLEIKIYKRWETLPFVLEDGVWKIDKVTYANQKAAETEEQNRKMDEMMKNATIPAPSSVSPL
jgi:hypothetical protein